MELEGAIKRCNRRINVLKLNYAITNEDLQAMKIILKALKDREKDNENWEKVYDEDEEKIRELNNKICDLEFKLENKDKRIITLNKIIDEEM